jgi:oligoribonuclease
VSTVKELAKRWYPSLDNERPFKVGAHRALDDIRDSVRELQFYRERIFIAARPVVPSQPSATPDTPATDAPAPDASASGLNDPG